MDRRNFLKTVILTPAITSSLLGKEVLDSSKKLYLLTDEPELYLPYLLKKLELNFPGRPPTYSFLGPHPRESKIVSVLEKLGWRRNPTRPNLQINFSHLRKSSFASFTLIDKGRVVDIRKFGLKKIWEEMAKSPASLLTIAHLPGRSISVNEPGNQAKVWINGKLIDQISLLKPIIKNYSTRLGYITLQVRNGAVSITHADCRHKICLSSSPINIVGERIICAPNRFVVAIQSKKGILDTVIG